MRFIIARFSLLCFVFVMIGMEASAQPYTFADVPWGTSRVRTRALLQARGYTYSNDDGSSEYYSGVLVQRPCLISVTFSEFGEGLLKISVYIRTSREIDGSVTRMVFSNIHEYMTVRYGESDLNLRACAYSYEGYQRCFSDWINGLRLHHITWSSYWPKRSGSDAALEVTPENDVAIHYEAPGWSRELSRRRTRQVRDF